VAALRDAAHRVGAGDLSVRVAPRGNDELDELARAFDVMVAELGDARSRLGYLAFPSCRRSGPSSPPRRTRRTVCRRPPYTGLADPVAPSARPWDTPH